MTKYLVATIGAAIIFCGSLLVCEIAIVMIAYSIKGAGIPSFWFKLAQLFAFIIAAVATVTSFRASLKANTKAPKAEPVKVTCGHCGEEIVAKDAKCPMCGEILDATAAAE